MLEKENSNPGDEESLRLVKVLMEQAAEGFTQVVLVNPEKRESKVLDLPKI